MKEHVSLFWQLLARHRSGDLVTVDEILDATAWKPSTFKTHLTKNKLTRFLHATGDRRMFRILRDGEEVLESEVAAALRQVTDTPLLITSGEVFIGGHSRYASQAALGRGAMAQVWRARALDGSPVAIKIFDPQQALLERTLHDDLRRRFKREAENGSQLRHARLVRIVDHGVHEGAPFLVMELASRSLADRLRSDGPMTATESLAVVGACASALQYLHGQAVRHRDVKPDNVLETERGWVLADLGIARWSDLNPAFLSAGSMTDGAYRLGTMAYVAPEQQARPQDAVNASDVYALGALWYELLTLRTETQAAFVTARAPAPSTDESLNTLITRMTSYLPADRPRLPEIGQFLASRGVDWQAGTL